MERFAQVSMKSHEPKLRRPEHGAVLVMLAILLPIFLMLIAIALNIGYSKMITSELKAAADAAAFAGAAALCNEDSNCYVEAREAAIATLNEHTIHGNLGVSKKSALDPTSTATSWSFPNLQVSIERGYLNADGNFTSMEAATFASSFPQLEKHMVANGVRVSISRPSMFMIFWPSGNRYDLTATSLATQGRSARIPVAPFALPLCSLMTNTGNLMPESERCRADRYFTSSDHYGEDTLPEFVYEASCGKQDYAGVGQSCPGITSATCFFPMQRFRRMNQHYGVVGLPVANYAGTTPPGTVTEDQVRTAIQSGSPSTWPQAGIGDAFDILHSGLTTPESQAAVFEQMLNFGSGTDQYHRAHSATDLAGSPDSGFRELYRSDVADCGPVLAQPSVPALSGQGVCRSMRFEIKNVPGIQCNEPDPIVYSATNPRAEWGTITNNSPVWSVKVPVIADVDSGAEACSAGPDIDPSHLYRVVGFIMVNLYDLDIGNPARGETGFVPWRPTLCDNLSGTTGMEVLDGDWEFPHACNLVRGKVDCTNSKFIPVSNFDTVELFPTMSE